MWWPIAASQNKNKIKQKNLKNEKILFRKKPAKISWPMSAKYDKRIFFIQKEKKHKTAMAQVCQI